MAGTNGNGHSNGHTNGNGNGKSPAGKPQNPKGKSTGRKNVPHSEQVKPTAEEMEIRVAFCFNLLAQGVKVWQVRERCCKKFELSPRTVERYLTRARNLIAQQIKVPLVELRNESLALYRAVAMDAKAPIKDRLRARALLDDLMGIRAPRTHEHSGPKGGDIPLKPGVTPTLIVNVVAAAAVQSPAPAALPAGENKL